MTRLWTRKRSSCGISLLLITLTLVDVNNSKSKSPIRLSSAFVTPSIPSISHKSLWNRNHCVISSTTSSSSSSSSSSTTQSNSRKDTHEPKTQRLSRPERKVQERKIKAEKQNKNPKSSGRRHHNFKQKNGVLNPKGNSAKEGRYHLHSQAISTLTKDSTADDVLRAIKRAQNLHDEHDIAQIENFLLEEVDEHFAYGYRGSLLARLAVAALHMSNHELARRAIEERRVTHRPSMLPMESAAIIRGMLRVHNVTDALQLLDDELSLPLKGTPYDTEEARERILHRSSAIASIASRHFFEWEPYMAVKACQMLSMMGPIVREAGLTAKDINLPWLRIIQGASQCESQRRAGDIPDPKIHNHALENVELPANLVYSVLKAMSTFPPENTDQIYEAISNALVRRTVFVTGAVTMEGMPKADRGEAVFIGRSNVGKSSLVNMVTNRKSLAYTSKRPGKTQQFNYFAVNDKVDLERELKYGDDIPGTKDLDSFYIVDLPGFGFAKVPDYQREQWSNLMTQYLTQRKTLRVVFHLVDARHGPIDDDERIMQQIGQSLPRYVTYVVVLTKADKNTKDAKKGKGGRVSKDVLKKLRETMKQNNVGNAPIILTSAETKLGRDDMWRYISKVF